MPIVKCKPTSPGRRFVEKVVNPDLYKGRPHAPLVESKKTILLFQVLLYLSDCHGVNHNTSKFGWNTFR